MKLLLDTNIFLEIILEQERAEEARRLISKVEGYEFFVSDYSVHSIGILLFHKKRFETFREFLMDVIFNTGVVVVGLSALEMERVIQVAQQFNLDFDDAYQYTVAEYYGLTIVSFDSDFDRTSKGRKVPGDLI